MRYKYAALCRMSMIVLQLKDPLELFVKRREFLPSSLNTTRPKLLKPMLTPLRAIPFRNTWGVGGGGGVERSQFQTPPAMIFFSCKPLPTMIFFHLNPPPPLTNAFHYFFKTPYPMCFFRLYPLFKKLGFPFLCTPCAHACILNVIHCRQ